jgi:hypothetical protein
MTRALHVCVCDYTRCGWPAASWGSLQRPETFGRVFRRGRTPSPNVGDPLISRQGSWVGRGSPDPARGVTAGLLVSLGRDERRNGDLRSGVAAGSETLAERGIVGDPLRQSSTWSSTKTSHPCDDPDHQNGQCGRHDRRGLWDGGESGKANRFTEATVRESVEERRS